MKVLILAGGLGSRLRPYTTVIPKPLMPVGELPILEIILHQLKQAGTTELILAVGYLSHLLQAFFGNGEKFGMKITYVLEPKPLGTAGPITHAIDGLGDDFIVMNGDVLTTLNYAKLFAAHCKTGAAATIAVNNREVHLDFGVIEMTKEGGLSAYIEKPTRHFFVSTGINVLNAKAARKHLKPGERLDMPQLMMKIKESGEKVSCFAEPFYWLDIGRVDDYRIAQDIFESRRAEFLPHVQLKAA